MGCPFAMFANITGINPSQHSSYHHAKEVHASSSSITIEEKSTLTEKMKEATWSVHRQLERSVGVSALMGKSINGTSNVDRKDYLKFLIMLSCIYAQMESIIINANSNIKQACLPILRTNSLFFDIQAHLDELLCTTNADIIDLLDLQDDEQQTVENDAKTFLTLAVQDAQANLTQDGILNDNIPRLNMNHINLLSSRQVDAVVTYIRRLKSLSKINYNDEGISFTPTEEYHPTNQSASITTSKPHPILAHAYVRYMGDLSGGQHMLKRLSKQFAIQHTDVQHGFAFYIFDKPAQLKESLRNSINSIEIDQSSTQTMIEEAISAFDLHHALFESLLDLPTEETTILLNEDQDDSLLALSIPGAFPIISFGPFSAMASA
jgi:heme oxygenase